MMQQTFVSLLCFGLVLVQVYQGADAAHQDTIPLCYKIIGKADSSIPVQDKSDFPHKYNIDVGDCPKGWHPGSGTVYISWPKKGTKECLDAEKGGYSGCRWAGLFSNVWPGTSPNCKRGAKVLPRPDGGDYKCRWTKATVRKWNVAATWNGRKDLLNKKIRVQTVERRILLGDFNVVDTCSDSDCGGCCSSNTANGKYPLIDMEAYGYCRNMVCTPHTLKLDQLPFAPNRRPS